MRSLALILLIAGAAVAQFENGHVRILQDKRYQAGGAFGNYRDQEDGIKYKEETDELGVRRGFWEYPDETGKLLRVEFEAGPGIGFRITNSNYLANSLIDNSVKPVVAPVRPVAAPVRPVVAPVQQHIPAPPPLPVVRAAALPPTTTTPAGPINIFDYPANLEFSRHAQGHSFKFSAA